MKAVNEEEVLTLAGQVRPAIMRSYWSGTIPETLMLTVHVHIQVKPDQVDAFQAACVENSRNSLQEPGIARFDVLQHEDDPTKFLLVEIYRTPDAPSAHKQTAHYQQWAETVADMMAVPRFSEKFNKIYPQDGQP